MYAAVIIIHTYELGELCKFLESCLNNYITSINTEVKMIEILYSMILLTVSFLVESTLDFDLEKIHMTCFLSDKPLLSFHFTPPMSFY